VFISWSGDRSRAIASTLHRWIPDVIQDVKPWMSRYDILSGARWELEIGKELNESNFGILCITRENMHSDWLLFEAGALAKQLSDSHVVPYLIGIGPSDLPAGPLNQFQCAPADREGSLRLVQDLNTCLGEDGLELDRLTRAFEKNWADLARELGELPESPVAPSSRPVHDMVAEILDTLRDWSRAPEVMTIGAMRVPYTAPIRRLERLILGKRPELEPFMKLHSMVISPRELGIKMSIRGDDIAPSVERHGRTTTDDSLLEDLSAEVIRALEPLRAR
jgi:hypothetical protein